MIAPPERQYILCIEDDYEDFELLIHVFQHIDVKLEIVNATDGTKALDFLEQAKLLNRLPEAIFLDINMCKLDGKETFVCLQADKVLARIPKMVLSTSNLDTDLNYFRKYQIPYLNKPGDVNKFKEELSAALKALLRLEPGSFSRVG